QLNQIVSANGHFESLDVIRVRGKLEHVHQVEIKAKTQYGMLSFDPSGRGRGKNTSVIIHNPTLMEINSVLSNFIYYPNYQSHNISNHDVVRLEISYDDHHMDLEIKIAPTNAGYSYGDSVSHTVDAVSDVFTFLLIFFRNFRQYAKLKFHIAGESAMTKNCVTVMNLESILIGNGLVNPLLQFKSDLPKCANSTQTCYNSSSIAQDCVNAFSQCFKTMINIRPKCKGSACYPDFLDILAYSNSTDDKTELGLILRLTFNYVTQILIAPLLTLVIGIWLFAHNIKPIHDKRIQPANVCEDSMIAIKFNDFKELKRNAEFMYSNIIQNNRMCQGSEQKFCALCYSCLGKERHQRDWNFDCDHVAGVTLLRSSGPKDFIAAFDEPSNTTMGKKR
ncbi:17292_t:CDS:2, partial [Racocetra persica]